MKKTYMSKRRIGVHVSMNNINMSTRQSPYKVGALPMSFDKLRHSSVPDSDRLRCWA